MTTDPERPGKAAGTWFAKQLGEGWTSAGDGIYYPPEPRAEPGPEPALALSADPAVPERMDAHRLPQRRRELVRLRERLVERVARFPSPVSERQLRELEQELAALVRRLGPFVARPNQSWR